jgi:uncharacterized protein YndB with AHSA1/START domain
MISPLVKPNPKLDLVLEREIDVPVELVWEAWTTPESVKQLSKTMDGDLLRDRSSPRRRVQHRNAIA